MSDDKSFDEFYAKFDDIVNSAYWVKFMINLRFLGRYLDS